MAKMRAIDAAVRVLEREGVTTAFGVPGAAINPLYSALKARGSIAHVLARHVEGAIHLGEDLDVPGATTLPAMALNTPGVVYKDLLIIGSNPGECWWSTDRSSWSGHQSRMVRGRCALGCGAGIPGLSLSLKL